MKLTTIASLASVALASGCVLEKGPPAEVEDRSIPRSIEEREEPGSLIILRRAKPETVDCPHCGAPNPPGRERCEVCGRDMAVKVFVPCPSCSSIADPELRAECTRCKGRGILEAPETNADRKAVE